MRLRPVERRKVDPKDLNVIAIGPLRIHVTTDQIKQRMAPVVKLPKKAMQGIPSATPPLSSPYQDPSEDCPGPGFYRPPADKLEHRFLAALTGITIPSAIVASPQYQECHEGTLFRMALVDCEMVSTAGWTEFYLYGYEMLKDERLTGHRIVRTLTYAIGNIMTRDTMERWSDTKLSPVIRDVRGHANSLHWDGHRLTQPDGTAVMDAVL